MAGFRIGRGRGSRDAQQQGQHHGPQGQPGQAPPGPGAYGQRPPQQWPHGGPGGHGEPEYLGEPHGAQPGPQPYAPGGQGPAHGAPFGPGPQAGGPQQHGRPQPPHGQPQYGPGPGADRFTDAPGHTRAFTIPDPYGPGGAYDGEPGTYGPGGQPAPPSGPRLHWKQLLSGVVLRPNATFWQMRDHAVWLPALIVTALYGLLAPFSLGDAREEIITNTVATMAPTVALAAVAFVILGLILGSVTHTLARQFGGTGTWAPTVGLSMLVMSLTDAPRLLVGLFLGGDNTFVQVLGWVTWVAAGALLASMVSRSHDLPWARALGASAVQLLAWLVLIKLGTV